MSTSAFPAVAGLLKRHDWVVASEGAAGAMFQKGAARIPVPKELPWDSVALESLLMNIAGLEKVPSRALRNELVHGETSPPAAPKPREIERGELDLHLHGAGVREHETDAYLYGRFVSHISDLVKNLAREQTGRHSMSRRLQVVGGAMPGSVEVILREPEEIGQQVQGALPGAEHADTPELRALTSIAQALNASEEAALSPDSSDLNTHLRYGLDVRRGFAQIAADMCDAGWDAYGTLRLPDQRDDIRVNVSMAGAWRLKTSATETLEETRAMEVHGSLDGWVWSTATMEFIPDSGRRIRAAVPASLQGVVAELNATAHRQAWVVFEVTERQSPSGGSWSKSYSLAQIAKAEPAEAIPGL